MAKQNEQLIKKLEREKKIKAEINKVKKLFKDLPKEKAKVLEGLTNEVAFMKVSLEETREDLIANGLTEVFEQGSQCFDRERPAVKIYTNLIQKYSAVMKQLIDLMPVEVKEEAKDELMEFISRSKVQR